MPTYIPKIQIWHSLTHYFKNQFKMLSQNIQFDSIQIGRLTQIDS